MRHEFDPWVGKIPWRRAWKPTLVLLPGESHGQRSLVGYSPQLKRDTAEATEHAHAEKERLRKQSQRLNKRKNILLEKMVNNIKCFESSAKTGNKMRSLDLTVQKSLMTLA